ncbi:MAG: hypothetical protein R6X06_00440 [Gammaproteobacteria bacterium]
MRRTPAPPASPDTQEAFEHLVLHESILSATGLNAESLQIGIRGDPSLRETTGVRPRYESEVDTHLDALTANFEELLLRRSTYRLFVGFNNGEIRTHSVFDPLTQEIHTAERLANPGYVARQFPMIDYAAKVQLVRDLYQALRGLPAYQQMPAYWRNILVRRSQEWSPMTQDEIVRVIARLRALRAMPVYYMRNITICMVQRIIRIQFNCDGTQILRAEDFQRFLDENIPSEAGQAL